MTAGSLRLVPVNALATSATDVLGTSRTAAAPGGKPVPPDSRLRAALARHLDLIWRVLRRSGLAAADAEDASQEVFWVFARRLHEIEPRAERSFLISTALRVSADRKRSRWHRSVDPGLELDEQAADMLGADEELELRRGALLLDRALSALDPRDRAVYVLSELEQMSRSEVAEVLGLTEGSVASRLRRARETCQAAVRRLHSRGLV